MRPRRSVLFMPGSDARAMEKAKSLPADAIVFDLEDAVAPDAKSAARDQVVQAVRAGGYGRREVVVRVNAFGTPWGREDLGAVARAGADAVLLPKVEAATVIDEVLGVLTMHGTPSTLDLWCMLETPRGILNAPAIAASRRVAALVMGTSDLTKDLHARHTRDRLPLVTSLGLCVLAARAAGIVPLDGVHLDLDDDAGFDAACRQARDFGFDGKTVIHPKQLAAANDVFSPSAEEIAWARRVIAAHADAVARGRGVVLLDGRLIENLHVADAQRVVALADALDAMGGD
ncbi:MAG: CoA ester lyase [Candidatus Rokubacteria bacterium]|nr:CoA ester lyase [Candidatus Rokubacteria bacterium]